MHTNFHHVAISVRNLANSQTFYEKLGFREVHHYEAPDNSLSIVHLKLDEVVLEIFAYAQNANVSPLEMDEANDLPQIGVKHIGLHVADVNGSYEEMQEAGYKIASPAVKHGRTQIDYFFIKDPDGMWVEIVQDDRGY